MKTPQVDYRGFRLSKLRDPRFSHLLLLLGWVFYFSMYFLTENLIPAERCHPIHCFLDDWIPFSEFFALFYVFWYLLVAGSLLYFSLYDVDSFKKLQIFIIITQVLAMACYILYPSRQDLRPEVFPRHNALTQMLAFLYAFDTNTGVCPSLHVAYSLGILSVFWKYRGSSRLWKGVLLWLVLMICMAVCFVKQHSVLDVLAALPVCLAAEAAVYGRDYWLPRLRRKKYPCKG